MKQCYKCKIWLDLDSFAKDKSRQDGFHPYCKVCRSKDNKKYIEENPEAREKRKNRSKQWKDDNPDRYKELIKNWKASNADKKKLLDKKSQLWSHYRLTIEKYLEILNDQNESCAICKKRKRLYVDHDHTCCPSNLTCGKCVRGLICQKCNMMMHYIDECRNLFERAIEYSSERAVEIYE
jgi:hypothetical protein